MKKPKRQSAARSTGAEAPSTTAAIPQDDAPAPGTSEPVRRTRRPGRRAAARNAKTPRPEGAPDMPGLPPAAPAELPGEEPEATGAPVVGVESAVRAQEARPEETDAERRRRRALFLRELAEAHELRERIQPRRTRTARLRQMMRMRTFRY